MRNKIHTFFILLTVCILSIYSAKYKIVNLNSSAYLVSIPIGNPSSLYSFQINTTSNDKTWIFGNNCKECPGNKFNSQKSSTYKLKPDKEGKPIIKQIDYEHSYIKGSLSTDQFWFESGNAENEFIYVESAINFKVDFNGSFSFAFPGDYFKKLKSNKYIQNSIAGLDLSLDFSIDSINSSLTVGHYDEGVVSKKDQIILVGATLNDSSLNNSDSSNYSPLVFLLNNEQNTSLKKEPDSYSWRIDAESIMIGNVKLDTNKIILSPNQFGISIPKNMLIKIKDTLLPNDSCQVQVNGYFKCDCSNDTQFQNFVFNFKEKTSIALKSSDFVAVNSNLSNENCTVYVKVNYTDDYIILGNIFFGRYYVYFDYDNLKVGLYDKANKEDSQGSTKILIITLIVVISTSVFFLLIYLAYKKCISRNEEGAIPAQS